MNSRLLRINNVLLPKVIPFLLSNWFHVIKFLFIISTDDKGQGFLYFVYQSDFIWFLIIFYSDLLFEVLI